LVVVGSNGGEIRSVLKTSRQKERLLEDQMTAYLLEILRKEADARSAPIQTIVIHRDGIIYESEIRGTRNALALLKKIARINQIEIYFYIFHTRWFQQSEYRLFELEVYRC